MTFQIKRRPVPEAIAADSKRELTASPIHESPSTDPPSAYEAIKKTNDLDAPIVEGKVRPDLEEQLANLELETDNGHDHANPIDEAIAQEVQQVAGAENHTSKSAKFKHALGEIKHFAGGLITHPFEATKHYSILRHSHGFVFYQGPTTSVTITVFSDQPLPADRKLWLQKKGFSGKTGMKIGTLGSRSAWIDVTPCTDATADSLPADNERAWQRDITKFLKKAKDAKNLCNHRPYETHVVRIPHVAEDGYFRIVLCSERKVLCPSPVFRYASSSLDPSVLRGASLRTLPLELGVMIGSFVANTAAHTATAGVLQPAVSSVQTALQPYGYGGAGQWAVQTAYDNSGAADRVDSAIESTNQQYDEKRELELSLAMDDDRSGEGLIGEDDGPRTPYPIRVSGRVAPGYRDEKRRKTIPTATLVDVPQDTLRRLSGTYFGWASVSRPKVASGPSIPDDAFDTWMQALITVAQIRDKNLAVVENRGMNVHILENFGDATFFNSKISLMIMGCVRPANSSPASSPGIDNQQAQLEDDVALAQRWLNRPAWQPEAVLERIKSESSGRSFSERMADARQSGQKHLDKVPVHRFGVRTESMGLRDQLIGAGGICIKR